MVVETYSSVAEQQQHAKEIRIEMELQSAVVSGQADKRTRKFLRRNGFPIDNIVAMPREERQRILTEVLPLYAPVFSPYVDQIEKLVKLDSEPQHAEQERAMHKEKDDAKHDLIEAIAYGGLSWDEVVELTKKTLITDAKYIEFRDEIAAQQIKKLAKDHPGKTIGIIYGSAHQLLTRMVDIGGVSMQRQFAMPVESSKSVQGFVNIYTTLLNTARAGFFDEKLLEKYVALYIALTTTNDKLVKKLRGMDATEFDALVPQIKELWSESLHESPDKSIKIYERFKRTEKLLLSRKLKLGRR